MIFIKQMSMLIVLVFFTNSWARVDSVLNSKVNLPGIGEVAYRGPLMKGYKETIVLFQGVFGGTTHRHMGEVRDLLDTLGYRVYALDLPGTGQSSSPKIIYTMEVLNQFVLQFLRDVVKEPAIVVGEQLLGTSALLVSKIRPDLFSKIVLISPAGVIYLAGPPIPPQEALFNKYWNDPTAAPLDSRDDAG